MSTYHQQFMRSTQQKYADMRKRSAAKWSKDGKRLLRPEVPMQFSLDQFRAWILARFQNREDGMGRCEYCTCPLVVATMVPDHKKALDRGGSNTLDNLAVACERDNDIKGRVSAEWFRYLRDCLAQMPDGDRREIEERLQKSEKAASSIRSLRRQVVKQQPPAAALAATAAK